MLDKEEFQLIKNSNFLLRKRQITNKISKVLADCESELKTIVPAYSSFYPEEALTRSGKISRGENYKGLPYLVLDFPRYSKDDETFIYRTMFWWGNYFLCLLVTQNCGLILKPGTNNETAGYVINLGATPWNYAIDDPGWKAFDKSKYDHPFIALGKKVDFGQVNNLPEITRTTFETIMSFLSK